jgi:hypothetical protein
VTRALLERVRSGELGNPPASEPDAAEPAAIRAGWL